MKDGDNYYCSTSTALLPAVAAFNKKLLDLALAMTIVSLASKGLERNQSLLRLEQEVIQVFLITLSIILKFFAIFSFFYFCSYLSLFDAKALKSMPK